MIIKTVIIDGTPRGERFRAVMAGSDYFLTMAMFRLLALMAFQGDWINKVDLYPQLVDGHLASRYVYRLRTEIPVSIENDRCGNYRLLNPTKIRSKNLKTFPDYQICRLAGAGVIGPGKD